MKTVIEKLQELTKQGHHNKQMFDIADYDNNVFIHYLANRIELFAFIPNSFDELAGIAPFFTMDYPARQQDLAGLNFWSNRQKEIEKAHIEYTSKWGAKGYYHEIYKEELYGR